MKHWVNFVAIIVIPFFCASAAQNPSRATVEKEFSDTISFVREYAQKMGANREAFAQAIAPYGPLDLQVTNQGAVIAGQFKNFFFGAAGSALGFTSNDLLEMTNRFHCGPPCAEFRKQKLQEQLPKIRELVDMMVQAKGLNIVSHWGKDDEFRVNNVFQLFGVTREAIPSKVMGFVPSGDWHKLDDLKPHLEEIGISRQELDVFLKALIDLGLVAVVRDQEGRIRVIREGLTDNEAGLLFVLEGGSLPEDQPSFPGGKEIVGLEEIAPNVFFYTTT